MARLPLLQLLAAVTVLGGCGFHLEGNAKLSPVMSVTYVEAEDTHTEFHRSFLDALDAAGVRVPSEREQATTIVTIKKDESGQRVLSVSAQNTPTEYEVFYTVTFTVNAGDKILLAPQTVTLTRDYSFDERALLAKGHEQELLRAALANDIVGIVMRRLASL